MDPLKLKEQDIMLKTGITQTTGLEGGEFRRTEKDIIISPLAIGKKDMIAHETGHQMLKTTTPGFIRSGKEVGYSSTDDKWKLDKDLTGEQREVAKNFVNIMKQCFKTSGKDCKCDDVTEFQEVEQ